MRSISLDWLAMIVRVLGWRVSEGALAIVQGSTERIALRECDVGARNRIATMMAMHAPAKTTSPVSALLGSM